MYFLLSQDQINPVQNISLEDIYSITEIYNITNS